jgi:HD-GYP domain-containing protein (c-di-GMP phosphodiesterase class II)
MADKISERLKKLLPPQLAEPEDGQPQIPQQVQQAMQQMQQQGQELEQKAQALSQAEEEINKKHLAVEKGTVELMSHEAELKNDATKLELDRYAFELEQREKELASNSAMIDSETKLKIAEMKQETDIMLSLHSAQHDEAMAERAKKEVPEAPEVEEPEDEDDSEESGKWDAIMTKLNEFGDKFQKTMEDKDDKINKSSAKLETQLSVLAKKVESQEKESQLVGSLQDIGKALAPKKRKVIRDANGKIEGIE